MRELVSILGRFSVVGILSTTVYFISANAIIYFYLLAPKSASLVAYFISMIVSFAGQSRFTFKIEDHKLSHKIRFAFMSLVGVGISYLFVGVAPNAFDIAPFWGTVITALLVPMINFIGMRWWVFK